MFKWLSYFSKSYDKSGHMRGACNPHYVRLEKNSVPLIVNK
jgi:hypothetical protein